MSIEIGEIVSIKIIEVLPYACWGEVNGQISFTHVGDWSNERPVPENCCPKVGQEMKAKVFYIATASDEPQRPDVSLDGKYKVDFAASFALLQPEENESSF